MAGRRRAAVHRRGAGRALVRAAARRRDRLAARARVRRAGPARARERDAQPRPHGDDGGGADGRPRARRLRRGVRRTASRRRSRAACDKLVRARRRRHAPRASQPLPPSARRRRARTSPDVGAAVGQYMDAGPGQRQAVEQHHRHDRTASRRASAPVYRLEWIGRRHRRAARAGCAATPRSSRSSSPRRTASRSGDRFRHPDADRRHARAHARSASTATRRSSRASSSTCRPSSASRALRDPFAYLRHAPPGGVRPRAACTRQSAAARAASRPPRSRSNAQYRDADREQLDQIVYLLYALLAMSVVISLFGIANSLFLVDPRAHARVRPAARGRRDRGARSGASSATRA